MKWAPYVPVAERRQNAAKKMASFTEKGMVVQPITVEGRQIATTFWGRAWCTHMESFCDHNNRLPRGKTYTRNGSISHLSITDGTIRAYVAGSSLYQVTVSIKPLSKDKWQSIKAACSGKISSFIELLSGTLSQGIMNIVCNPTQGLFPSLHEFKLECTCPDYATMCKHVAAVLYGVGARLDSEPTQLFTLRAVNITELIDINQAIADVTTRPTRRKRLDDNSLSQLFQLDLSTAEERLTGNLVQSTRQALGLTKAAFAQFIDVSAPTIALWESKGAQALQLQARMLTKLKKVLD